MTLFADRGDAGRQLAKALEHVRGADAVVFGVPRGGVVVAAETARGLDLPLDVVIVRKLGSVLNGELAVGAIAEGVRVVTPAATTWARMTEADLARIELAERVELDRRTRLFAPAETQMEGRTAIVVDDGVATGATATAACRAVKARGAVRVVLAVPVAPDSWSPPVDAVDEYVCPHREPGFRAVGQYYADFDQTTDDEVSRLLVDRPSVRSGVSER